MSDGDDPLTDAFPSRFSASHHLPPTAAAFRPPRHSPPVARRPIPETIKTRRPEQPAPLCLRRGVESEKAAGADKLCFGGQHSWSRSARLLSPLPQGITL